MDSDFHPWASHHFTILFASKSASLDSWDRVMLSSDRKVGILELRNGDKVVLCQRKRAMVKKQEEYVLSTSKDMRIEWEQVPEVFGASLSFPGTDDAGHPYIVDIPLAWDNVFLKKT